MAEFDGVYRRPREGFRLRFRGIKTNSTPDATRPEKFPYAVNIRAVGDNSIQTRQGSSPLFPTGGVPVTDIRAYSALNTDNLPRFLARGSDDRIWLSRPGNTSIQAGALATTQPNPGACMIPFRPAESPTPYMYIANGQDYQKFSAPSGLADTMDVEYVGIAEPQSSPDAVPTSLFLFPFSNNPGFVSAGVAGAVANNSRVTDTAGVVFVDPVGIGIRYVQVSAAISYQRQMQIAFAGNGSVVLDVIPALPTAVGISSIYYTDAHHCVFVPNNLTPGPGTEGSSIYQDSILSSLRRGSIIRWSGNGEFSLVWSVVKGPDGTVCIETSTTSTHAATETITSVPSIAVPTIVTTGQAISALGVSSAISGAGFGTITGPVSVNPFVNSLFSFQPEDYFHIAINISALANLNEIKVLLDVGDGSFSKDFYYYTVRASDVEAGIQNTLTQLGVAQLVTQRAIIDEEQAATAHGQGKTASSAQTSPGDGQWSDILFPLSAFTRVGNDQTRSLMNVGKIQYLVNAAGAFTLQIADATVTGGYQPDVGPSGAPYLYRVRPRSSRTGVKGNPSPAMRYGVSPRRQLVQVALPSGIYSPQIDTWDVFRYGGSVTSWRKIGQTSSTNATFLDNYSDEAALAGEELEFDNLEPWPSIDVPMVATCGTFGFYALVYAPSSLGLSTKISQYLPGNLIRIGTVNTYTLRSRPIKIGLSNYRFELMENAGSLPGGSVGGTPFAIYEPLVARQFLPYMWGPDASGTVFAVGDPLRPGTLSFAKNYAPDSAPDSYNIEITSPSEPLLGGEVLDGLSFVASTERWWALYPQPQNPLQRYSVVQQPIPRGLAAPYGHCTDGKTIWFWAKDGIWSSDKGSLTDADLYNLFPHEGVPGRDYTYNGQTIKAPNYSRCGTFRLTHCNYHLYATYQDITGAYRTLVYDLRREAWYWDVYGVPVSTWYTPEQQEGTLLSNTVLYPMLVAGGIDGEVVQQADQSNDASVGGTIPISAAIATMEWDGGDVRAGEQWGDLWLDSRPRAVGGIVATPMAFGAPIASPTTVAQSSIRVQQPISVGGEVVSDFLGLMLAWTDNFLTNADNLPTHVNIWQPSFTPKPETIFDRFTDWYDEGTERAKFVQGFILHADTINAVKGIVVRDSDALATHSFTPQVQHNGESIKAYSFDVPFVAHLIRLEPTDSVPWRFFDISWIIEPTPESAETWQTQATSFGLNGYSHIQRIVAAYSATSPVTLTITSFDGQSPLPITLPSTGGAYQKLLVVLTANKGQLFTFKANSSAPFQIYVDDFEVLVGSWSRTGGYLTWKSLGSPHGVKALV